MGVNRNYERQAREEGFTCLCSCGFCGNCGEEAHRPVDCETVSKWILKKEFMHMSRMYMGITMACPHCHQDVKNHGRNHTSCSVCKYQFCWICHCSLEGHKDCHKYKGCGETGRARDPIHRYMHYVERWARNHSWRLMAMEDLEKWRSVQLKKLSVKTGTQRHGFRLVDTHIVECRRVLKWTYAYGYYHLPEQGRTKRQFFEHLQGEAEVALERLHRCADQELKSFVNEAEDPSKSFNDFRRKLIGLTKVTKTYFENLVEVLEYECKPKASSEKQRLGTRL
ncbi:unnamed protein product [Thlaspi arvense]|uniref:RING-type domain-containing protein n=1 Tax=Thlaspi arvense TaxID=13288 RepID=A0AAU9S3T3_THLAR|nr:unnamed protein product [Thlaspi arvense]